MNKTKYIRTSSGSMIPVYPHPDDKKESSLNEKEVLKEVNEDETSPPRNTNQ